MDRAQQIQETLSYWRDLRGDAKQKLLSKYRVRDLTGGYLDNLGDDALADIHHLARSLTSVIRVDFESSPGMVLKIYRQELVLDRVVFVPGATSLADPEVIREIGQARWAMVEWHRVEEPAAPTPETEPINTVTPISARPWRSRWGAPSERTLDMERDEPDLFLAIKERIATYVRFPFGLHGD